VSHLGEVPLKEPPKHRESLEFHSHCDVHYLICHFQNNILKALYAEKIYKIPIPLEPRIQEIAYIWYQSYNAAILLTAIEKYSCKTRVSCIITKILPLRS
jgi:hypothetical protein